MAPPGLVFISSLLARTLPTPVSIYIALTFSPLSVSNKLVTKISLACLSIVVQSFVLSVIKRIRRNRDMKRLGAQPIPVVKGRLPLNYDVLEKLLEEENGGYLGYRLGSWTQSIAHTYAVQALGDNMLFTIEPENIKRILATEFPNFEKGSEFITAMHSVLGVGVFNADDEMWKFHRSMTRPFFSRERVSDFELFDRHWNKTISVLRNRLREGEAVDFQDLVGRFTLDSATDFLFGKSVESLASSLPYPHTSAKASTTPSQAPAEIFVKSFVDAQYTISHRTRMGWLWPLGEFFRDKTKDDMTAISNFVEPIIAEALKAKKQTEKVGFVDDKTDDETRVPEGETLLGHLVKCTDDRRVIKDETINILIAGRDTTAITLTCAVYMLCMHPDVCVKLRNEVMNHIGPNRDPTYDDIRNMKYLRAFINEVLRVYPPVPYDSRASKKATTFAHQNPSEKSYYVPPNTRVTYSALVLHHSKKFWGPTALEFDPERFLDERLGRYLTPNPFIFVPFNAGPRICLGQQFAYNETSFFLVRLLQSFSSFTLARDAQPPHSIPPAEYKSLEESRGPKEMVMLKSALTMAIEGGLWVRMTEAKDMEVEGFASTPV